MSQQSVRSKVDWTKDAAEKLRFTFDFTPNLLPGRLIGSVAPISVDNDDAALTVALLGDEGISTTEIVDDEGRTIAVGKAVLVRIEGGTPGREYHLRCQVTDDNPTEAERDEIVLTVPLHIV